MTAGADTDASRLVPNSKVNESTAGKRISSDVLNKKLTEKEIVDQCSAFLIGGLTSQLSTLSYCTYELAVNSDIQDRLVAETREAFNEHNGDIDYDTLCGLPLLDAVISETLRKYPADVRLKRVAEEDVVLSAGSGDGSTLRIEKGVMVEIPVYAIQHDPDYYPDPFAFRPDRFMRPNVANITPYTHFPFGSGPRQCVAMRFALVQVKLLVAKMLQQFRFYAVPDTDIPLVFIPHPFQLKAKRIVVGVKNR
ncbi:unnamed protein product [Medioppia subpectinata]|uniref:Cytochrome P450 n=1 Tax=Medioppia subpectinata TaxID=1979941 RepID=A0A7R9KGH3_9ACAR|nr:unnamed protein product [Medioppia subpectinata]CAG2101755.1 unnamed protein product [Medioppia subpectinata]